MLACFRAKHRVQITGGQQRMISVIIPSYNREKTIGRTIDSVLNQTFKDIEVIIVDDCSIDNTTAIVSAYNDSRIHYIKHEQNRGACAARNTGVKYAKGEYIAFQDSDDEWMPDKLEKQMDCLEKDKAEICISRFLSRDVDSHREEVHPFGEVRLDEEHFLERSYISTQVLFGYKYCFLDEKFDESLPRLQDWELSLRLIRKYRITFCDSILAIQNIQIDSITKDKRKELIACKIIYQKHENTFLKYPHVACKMLERIAVCEWKNGQAFSNTLKQAYEINSSYKMMIKLILSRLGFMDIFFRLKYGEANQ